MFKKLVIITIATIAITNSSFAYDSVDCSTNPAFGQYGCNECFNGGQVKNGDNISFLDDLWKNPTTNEKLMYKEEIVKPKMNATSGAEFSKKPTSDDSFWETTPDLENLYSSGFDGYVLPAGKDINWIRSTVGSAYNYQNKSLSVGATAGVLVFDIMSHDIMPNKEISMSEKPHRECVAYANASPIAPTPVQEPKPKPQEMTKVKTGPSEYILVLMLSFLLGIAFLNRKVVLEKIRK